MSEKESVELVAGHPPAVKAGGKRVVTKHKPHEKPDDDAYDQKYIDQLPEQPNVVVAPVMVPVGKTGVEHVEPTVSSPHTKPLPKVQKGHSPSKARQINQPR